MLGDDSKWYLGNMDKISAFKQYIKWIEDEHLPGALGRFVKDSIQVALEDFDAVRFDSDTDTNSWWYLEGAYEPDTEFGACAQVVLPESVDWLSGAGGDRPELMILTYGGQGPKGKSRARAFAELVARNMTFPKG